MLNVIERAGQNGKTYSNVSGVTPVPAMIKQNGLPQAVNKNEMFNLTEPDMTLFETFSDHLKAKIEASPEWQKLMGKPAAEATQKAQAVPAMDDDDDGDIPF